MRKFDDFSAYLGAFRKDPALALIPKSLVAEHFGISPEAVASRIRAGTLEAIKIGRKTFVRMRCLIDMEDAAHNEVKIVTDHLVALAKEGTRSTFYAPVMALIGLDWSIPAHRTKIGKILGEISELSYSTRGVMLSVLVHRNTAGTTLPGPGFFALAESLEYEWDDDYEFVENETERVLNAYH